MNSTEIQKRLDSSLDAVRRAGAISNLLAALQRLEIAHHHMELLGMHRESEQLLEICKQLFGFTDRISGGRIVLDRKE